MDQKQEHAELVDKILSGARWATVLRLSSQAFSWLSTILVVRFISPADYGLNAMLESPLILMMLLSTIGLDAALVQAKKIKPDELQSIFGFLLILNGVLFLCYFFGGAIFASYYHEPRLDLLAKALAFVFVLVPFRVIPNALLDRQLDFKLRAQLETITTVVAAITVLALGYLGAGVWALVSGVIVGRLLMSVLLMIFMPWFIVPRFNFSEIGRMVSIGGIMALGGAFFMLSDQLVSLIAGPRLGAALLGVFAVSSQFAYLPLAKGMPMVNQTLLPAFSKFQEHRDSATYYLHKLLGVTSLAFFPMMVGMASVADTLVLTVFGVKWAASIVPLVIMSIGMIFRMNNQLLKTVMNSMGRADLSLISNFLQLALMVPMIIYGVEYGVTGLVAAWVATELLVTLAVIQLSKRVVDTNFILLIRCYVPALVSAALMAACVIGIKTLLGNQSGLPALLLAIATGIVSYYLATRLLFLKELQTAFHTVLGNRLRFLTARSGKF
ncbi:MAG: lipopolysaccharide biosynthesis protein [Gallionellaceae bacterium]